MTITIREDDGRQATYDNQSMMASRGKIGYGVIAQVVCNGGEISNVCYDGEITKKDAKEKIIEALKEFLK